MGNDLRNRNVGVKMCYKCVARKKREEKAFRKRMFQYLKDNLVLQEDHIYSYDEDGGKTIFLDLALRNPKTGKLETLTGVQFDV